MNIILRPMASQSDADAFRSLNELWITRCFKLEDSDRIALGDPFGEIVAKGGQVYMAVEGEQVRGTAALIRQTPGIYQLAKMTVAPEARGRGIGRRVLAYTVEQARLLGARKLFLGSSTKLASAVHLYEAIGFRHIPVSELPDLKYERADVFMEMDLC